MLLRLLPELTLSRLLVTHSGGLAYTFMHPLSIRYRELQGERPLILQTIVRFMGI